MTDREMLAEMGLAAYLMSFALTAKQYAAGEKTVTRRGGPDPTWKRLKPGDLIEGVEWSPRVGSRWACTGCGHLGPTKVAAPPRSEWRPKGCGCPAQNLAHRPPKRLGLALVLDVREVRLGDITAADVVAEGFPGLTPADFVRGYCGELALGDLVELDNGLAPASKGYPWRVTRIEFQRVVEGKVRLGWGTRWTEYDLQKAITIVQQGSRCEVCAQPAGEDRCGACGEYSCRSCGEPPCRCDPRRAMRAMLGLPFWQPGKPPRRVA